jgi:hypothetical protein
MATRNGGPACPKVERLEELMDYLSNVKQDTRDGEDETLALQRTDFNDTIQECIEALDYLHTSLTNRKSYHQKRQAEQKLFMETARKLLSKDELEAITKQAEREING